MILEIFKATGTITVNDFNATTAAVLAILLVRFFQEGQVIPALKLLVLTMIKATRELVNFMIVVSPLRPPPTGNCFRGGSAAAATPPHRPR